MKKTLLLTLALGLVGASPLKALDLYITGSTAFRANVFNACNKLFSPAPTVTFGDAAHGGDANNNSSTASWCMTGTPIAGLTSLSGNPLTVHGLFTGSIQGIQTVEQQVPLTFVTSTAGVYSTNTPTIGFSDASGTATPYTAQGNFAEEAICVQPFVMAKGISGGPLTNINNVTWDELEYGIPNGYIPLSAWTQKTADRSTLVYLIQRTKDSGTRRCETAQELYAYGDPVGTYIYDKTNNFFFLGTNALDSATGANGFGLVGPAGLGNANTNWGSGYVGGGDIKAELNINNSNNLAIAYLSMNDSKGVGNSGNWGDVLAFNGLYPTAGPTGGTNIWGNTGTNDYSPVTTGLYPCWGYEVVVYPTVDPSGLPGQQGQNLTADELGNQTTPGTILGVLDQVTLSGVPTDGSIDKEIYNSESVGGTGFPATAVRLADMKSSRAQVGGPITP